jgi:diguanylate cyclase (GGDEF)-like protein
MRAQSRTTLRWTQYLAPTDAVYIIGIVLGLFVLVFLDETPIRLIGACIVLLAGVFLVINVSARMREKVAWSPPKATQTFEFKSQVRTSTDGTKRIVFDDYASSFSGDGEEQERQHLPEPSTHTPSRSQSQKTAAQSKGESNPETASTEQGDDISSVRIVRKRTKPAEESTAVPSATDDTPHNGQSSAATATTAPAPKVRHIQLSLTSLIEESFEEEATEPRREFSHILKGVMHVLRSTMNARTVTFFWYNPDRAELIFEASLSDVADSIRTQRKFPLGDDIISHIATEAQAQIVCDIQQSAECDLLPYYYQATGAKSFAGVPIFLYRTVVGVLSVDSAENDAYDEQTIAILGQSARLISMLVQSYTAKYDLQQNARTLETIVHFRRLLQRRECTVHDIAQALVNVALTLVEAKGAGVVLYSTEHSCWEIVTSSGDGLPPPGTALDLDDTAIAATLREGTVVHCQHCQSVTKRYWKHEQSSDDGYFVAVPLRTPSENYGALFVESIRGRTGPQDIAALEIIGEHAGMLIAQLVLGHQIRERALIDESTNVYNAGAFYRRLEEEHARCRDEGKELVVGLVQLDRYSAFEQQPSAQQLVLDQLLAVVRTLLKPYHIIGKLDSGMIGIALVALPRERAYGLIEHIRKKIASTPISIEGRTIVATVSVGVAVGNGSQTIESIVEHARSALQQAVRRSNAVVSYN